ncbi:MAG: hypothetical protein GX654_13370 [Desulfatiglans sp.]|jgi:hypothetical protein|nr:hypothetical protein [Desulfatiglans sp.]
MTESKYEKYIVRGIATKESIPGVMPSAFGEPEGWAGIDHRMKWDYVSKPVQIEEAHSHDFEEFLCFMGTNPADTEEFGAEIDVLMGKEGEKQVINTPTVVVIPRGMVHSPINFRKVDKPVIYSSIYMAKEYIKSPA